MSKVKKKKTSNKFDTDVVSNSVVGKYGDVVSTGTEVLATINDLEVVGISPALDMSPTPAPAHSFATLLAHEKGQQHLHKGL